MEIFRGHLWSSC